MARDPLTATIGMVRAVTAREALTETTETAGMARDLSTGRIVTARGALTETTETVVTAREPSVVIIVTVVTARTATVRDATAADVTTAVPWIFRQHRW